MKIALYAALLPLCLPGQTIIESGLVTGSTAATAGASGKSAAKALGNVFGSVEKTLKSAGKPQSVPAAAAAPVPGAAAEKSPEPVKLPDVSQINAGMTREDLLARFGNPSQKMTIPEGSHLTERYRYDVEKDSVKVILEDGKVKEAILIRPEPVSGVQQPH